MNTLLYTAFTRSHVTTDPSAFLHESRDTLFVTLSLADTLVYAYMLTLNSSSHLGRLLQVCFPSRNPRLNSLD